MNCAIGYFRWNDDNIDSHICCNIFSDVKKIEAVIIENQLSYKIDNAQNQGESKSVANTGVIMKMISEIILKEIIIDKKVIEISQR